MKIAIANDHTAVELKQEILPLIKELGHEAVDFGTDQQASCDYPVFGEKAARAVAAGECDLGIVICGTGIGIGLAANKVPGIRCAICSESYSAAMARLHNDANMIAFGARVVGSEVAKLIVKTFLTTAFDGGSRHARRVGQIMAIGAGQPLL